jgi:hypothetical protein
MLTKMETSTKGALNYLQESQSYYATMRLRDQQRRPTQPSITPHMRLASILPAPISLSQRVEHDMSYIQVIHRDGRERMRPLWKIQNEKRKVGNWGQGTEGLGGHLLCYIRENIYFDHRMLFG